MFGSGFLDIRFRRLCIYAQTTDVRQHGQQDTGVGTNQILTFNIKHLLYEYSIIMTLEQCPFHMYSSLPLFHNPLCS